MVVADVTIDKDHTVSIYCERDQIKKVEALFSAPLANGWRARKRQPDRLT